MEKRQNSTPDISKGLILLLAIAAGISVANLYYNQPLLADIAKTFHISFQEVGLLSTFTQLGYASGIFLFVPLGDIKEKRKVILVLIAGVTISLLGVASAPNIYLLYIFCFTVGLSTGIPQLIVPLAAQLVTPEKRGKAIGTIASAMLIGILMARTLSGSVGFLLGWRYMFVLAAAIMGLLGLVLFFKLPKTTPDEKITYGNLLKSLLHITIKYKTLRKAAITGAMMFGAFSVFWTTLTFLLESPAFGMNSNQIGMFGLVGVIGAVGARMIGGLNDKIRSSSIILACIILGIFSYSLLGLSTVTIPIIIVGIIALDFGVQGTMVSNQTVIIGLNNSERSRLNTVYIVSIFIGGAVGSTLGAIAWETNGWSAVCMVGFTLILIAFFINISLKRTKLIWSKIFLKRDKTGKNVRLAWLKNTINSNTGK